jgi:hypothetical protein
LEQTGRMTTGGKCRRNGMALRKMAFPLSVAAVIGGAIWLLMMASDHRKQGEWASVNIVIPEVSQAIAGREGALDNPWGPLMTVSHLAGTSVRIAGVPLTACEHLALLLVGHDGIGVKVNGTAVFTPPSVEAACKSNQGTSEIVWTK